MEKREGKKLSMEARSPEMWKSGVKTEEAAQGNRMEGLDIIDAKEEEEQGNGPYCQMLTTLAKKKRLGFMGINEWCR